MAKTESLDEQRFDPGVVEDYLYQNGWQGVERIKSGNFDLVPVRRGAALLCIDGRNALSDQIDPHAPKIPGGLNAIALTLTGGDTVGFNAAARLVNQHGFRPGTHGDQHEGDGCGLYKLWKNGLLNSAVYPLNVPYERFKTIGLTPSDWIKLKEVQWGGDHYTLPENHQETRAVFNYASGQTVLPAVDAFIFDKWFLRLLGVPYQRSLSLINETVLQLAPKTVAQIIIP